MSPYDPESAAEELDDALDDGTRADFMRALRQAAEEYGGIGKLALKSGLSRETLYRTLSTRGNPSFKTLTALLKAMGMRLAVEATQTSRSMRSSAGNPPA